jgi:hypothetical protein
MFKPTLLVLLLIGSGCRSHVSKEEREEPSESTSAGASSAEAGSSGKESSGESVPVAAPVKLSASELSLEVAALKTLHELKASRAQLEVLRKWAAETARKGAVDPGKVSNAYRKALQQLYDALLNDNDDQVKELEDKLERLSEATDVELDDDLDSTAEARNRAPEALRLFTTREIVSYIDEYGDKFPDPLAELLNALNEIRELKKDKLKEHCEKAARSAAELVAGFDDAKQQQLADRALQLLKKASTLSDEEFKDQKPELERSIRALLTDVSPADVIRNVLHRDMAELLTNPRLKSAIDARLAR